MSVKGFNTENGVEKYDFHSLDNIPESFVDKQAREDISKIKNEYIPLTYLYGGDTESVSKRLTADDFIVCALNGDGTVYGTDKTRIVTEPLLSLDNGEIMITCQFPYAFIVYFYNTDIATSEGYLGKTSFGYTDGTIVNSLEVTSGTKEGATHCRIALRNNNNTSADLSDSISEFVQNVPITQTVQQGGEPIITNIKEGNFVSIPKTIYLVVGNEFKLYYKNVVSRTDCKLWFGNVSGITVKRYADYLSITATETMAKTIKYKLYDEQFNVVESGEFEVIAKVKTAKDCKVIHLGDSLVEQGSETRQMLANNFLTAGGSITFLGTRGTSPLLHEGRGGWRAKDYCTKASVSEVTNPFYNNGFDFSYYMSQQGYDEVDIVIINLGINDIFSKSYENFNATEILEYLQTMITSILAYNNEIKVIVNLITPPTGNAELFTSDYGTSQIDFIYLVNTIRFAKAEIEEFSSNSSVTLSANNCVLDMDTDFANGVHLNATGYEKLGQTIYEVINGVY